MLERLLLFDPLASSRKDRVSEPPGRGIRTLGVVRPGASIEDAYAQIFHTKRDIRTMYRDLDLVSFDALTNSTLSPRQ
jgi:hypothetical protein